MAFKGSLPFPAHFLVIRKWPPCRQVDRDPGEKGRIWRTLKLDNEALSGGEGTAVMACPPNRWLILSSVVGR